MTASIPLIRAVLLASLAAAPLAAAQQVALGRLFATPAEREALDRQREAGPAASAMPGAADPAQAGMAGAAPGAMPPPQAPAAGTDAASPPASSAVQLSGVLRGSSGRTTVWLNQVPQTGGVKAGPGTAVSLRLSSGRRLVMKPGQSFDPDSGSVQEIGR